MDALARAGELESQGKPVIHMEVGQPDFPTPEFIKEAAFKALKDNKTGYTNCMGIVPLREAIAEYYHDNYGVTVHPDQIVITQGTSPALMMILSVLCERGDSVLMPDPCYASYSSLVNFAEAEPVLVPATEEQDFQLDPDRVEKALRPNTRAILVNSPSNPGGTLVGREVMSKLASFGRTLVSDEIYHGLVYEGATVSAMQVTDNCCLVDGFSKRYSMTGWRLGWIVAPKDLIGPLLRFQQNFFVCANSFTQWAGLAAIKHGAEDVKRMAAEYNRRRHVIVNGLNKLGFNIKSTPAGAFYVLANARHISSDSIALASDILEKTYVGVTAGVDFGPGAEGYLRFSYANSVENIEEALERLKKYLENRL